MRNLLLVSVIVLNICALHAQEVKNIDLTSVVQRTELRFPPAPTDGKAGVGGGSMGVAIGDGAPDRRDPHALGVYLENVNPTEIVSSEPFAVEFKVLNTGVAPIEIPLFPHLADLQPNETSRFEYTSLALVVRVTGVPNGRDVTSLAMVELYGTSDREETMLTLKPGEWIRVKAKVKLRQWPQEPVDARFRGEFWLRKNTFTPHPGGSSIDIRNLYPNPTATPWTTVHLLPPGKVKTPQ